MTAWIVVATLDDVTHVVESIEHGGMILFCRQLSVMDPLVRIETTATPLTCLDCAAWWEPVFGDQ